MIDRQSQIGIGDLRSFKNSQCFSDSLGFQNILNTFVVSNSSGPWMEGKSYGIQLQSSSQYKDKGQEFYKLLFSPQKTVVSLIKRNQYLEMKCFENEQPEHDQIYKYRNEKVSSLKHKQTEQLNTLMSIKQKQDGKYHALVNLMKLFASIKSQTKNIRNDYYSNKTFNALKNTPEQKLRLLTNVLNKMFNDLMLSVPFIEQNYTEEIDYRMIEFLVIPRFLISRQKVIRFAEDEDLQNNFKLLIYTGCLGHYNNEANKKFPEKHYIEYVRRILMEQTGRQKYKKICSINHGGKFITKNKDKYYNLFCKNLESLRKIENQLKKSNKDQMKKVIQKLESYQNQQKITLKYENKIQMFQRGLMPAAKSNKQIIQDSFSEFINSDCKQPELLLTKAASKNYLNCGLSNVMSFSKIKKSVSLPTQFKQASLKQQKISNIAKNTKCAIRRASTLQIVPPPVTICEKEQQYDFQ